MFEGLDGLVLLNLSRNAVSSHLLSANTFVGLASLKILDLSHNQITKIEATTFSLVGQLQVLHLHFNHDNLHTSVGIPNVTGCPLGLGHMELLGKTSTREGG